LVACFSDHTNSYKDGGFSFFKRTVDTLVVVGSPLSHEDHINAILDGLSKEYDSFITLVTSQLDPYSVEEIKALILVQEKHFENNCASDQNLPQANLVYTSWSTDTLQSSRD